MIVVIKELRVGAIKIACTNSNACFFAINYHTLKIIMRKIIVSFDLACQIKTSLVSHHLGGSVTLAPSDVG